MSTRKISRKLTKDHFLTKAMSYEPDRAKFISKLLEQLHEYEKKYCMRSEIFFKLIVGTPLEDQDDFLDWMMCYRQYFNIMQLQLSAEKAVADAIG